MADSGFISERVAVAMFGIPAAELRAMATGDPVIVRAVRSGECWAYRRGDLQYVSAVTTAVERYPLEGETAQPSNNPEVASW